MARRLGLAPEELSIRRIEQELAALTESHEPSGSATSTPIPAEVRQLIDLADSRSLLASLIDTAIEFNRLSARVWTAGPRGSGAGQGWLDRLVRMAPGDLNRRLQLLGIPTDSPRPPGRSRWPSTPSAEPPGGASGSQAANSSGWVMKSDGPHAVSAPAARRGPAADRRVRPPVGPARPATTGPVAARTRQDSHRPRPLAPVAGSELAGKPDGDSEFHVPDLPRTPAPIDCALLTFQYLQEENPNTAQTLADTPPVPDADFGGTIPEQLLAALGSDHWDQFFAWDKIADLLDDLGPGAAAYVVTESRHARRVAGRGHALLVFHDRAQPGVIKWRDALVDAGAKQVFERRKLPSGLFMFAVVYDAEGNIHHIGESSTGSGDLAEASPRRAVSGADAPGQPGGRIDDRDLDTHQHELAETHAAAVARADRLRDELTRLSAVLGIDPDKLMPGSDELAEWTSEFQAKAEKLADLIAEREWMSAAHPSDESGLEAQRREWKDTRAELIRQLLRPGVRQRMSELIDRFQRGLQVTDGPTWQRLTTPSQDNTLADLHGIMRRVILDTEGRVFPPADSTAASESHRAPSHAASELDRRLADLLGVPELLPRWDGPHASGPDPFAESRLLSERLASAWVGNLLTTTLAYLEIGRLIAMPRLLISARTQVAWLRAEQERLELLRLNEQNATAGEIAGLALRRARNLEWHYRLRLQLIAGQFGIETKKYHLSKLRELIDETRTSSDMPPETIEELASAFEDHVSAVEERNRLWESMADAESGEEQVPDQHADSDTGEIDLDRAVHAGLDTLDALIRAHRLRGEWMKLCHVQPSNLSSELPKLRNEIALLTQTRINRLVDPALIPNQTALTVGRAQRSLRELTAEQKTLSRKAAKKRKTELEQWHRQVVRFRRLSNLLHYVEECDRLSGLLDRDTERVHGVAEDLTVRWAADSSHRPPPQGWEQVGTTRVYEPAEQDDATLREWGGRVAAAADRRRRVFDQILRRARQLEVERVDELRPRELRDTVDALIDWAVAFHARAGSRFADSADSRAASHLEDLGPLVVEGYFPLFFEVETVERATRAEAATAIAEVVLRDEVIDRLGGQMRAPGVAVVAPAGEQPQVFIAGSVWGLHRALADVPAEIRAELDAGQAQCHFREIVVDENGRVHVREVRPVGRQAPEPDQPGAIAPTAPESARAKAPAAGEQVRQAVRAAIDDTIAEWHDQGLAGERVTDSVAYLPDGAGGGTLVIAAPLGLHLRALSELAVSDPARFAGALWRREFDRQYVRVTPGADGSVATEICGASEAEGRYREATIAEIEGILLDEYLCFRQLGLVQTGFGGWLAGVGEHDGTLQAFGYAMAKEKSAVDVDLPHPTAVLIRIITRQIALPDAAEPPGPIGGSLVVRGEVDLGGLSAVVELTDNGHGWRIAPPHGHGDAGDVVSRWFGGMADLDPDRLLQRVTEDLAIADPQVGAVQSAGTGLPVPIRASGTPRSSWQLIASVGGRPLVVDIRRGDGDWRARVSEGQQVGDSLNQTIFNHGVHWPSIVGKGENPHFIQGKYLVPLLREVTERLRDADVDQSVRRPSTFDVLLSTDELRRYHALVQDANEAGERLRIWTQECETLARQLGVGNPDGPVAPLDQEARRALQERANLDWEALADSVQVDPMELASVRLPDGEPAARRRENLRRIQAFIELHDRHGELSTALSRAQQTRDGFLTSRVVDAELEGRSNARRLNNRIGYVPDAASGVLVVAAPQGGHMTSLLRLAADNPEFADALWRDGLDKRYLEVTLQPEGRLGVTTISAEQAEGPRRRPLPEEVPSQLLHHYLLYRQAGLTSAGLREWLDQLGPTAFDSSAGRDLFGRPTAVQKPLAGGHHLLQLGYRMVVADPTIGLSHPAHVLFRLRTRQIPPLAWSVPDPQRPPPKVWATNLGDTMSEVLRLERSHGRWRLSPGDRIQGVLASHLGNMTAKTQRGLVKQVETFLRGRAPFDAYDSHPLTYWVPQTCFLVAAQSAEAGPGPRPKLDIPPNRLPEAELAGVDGRDAARWARANWHSGGYKNAAAVIEHVRRSRGTVIGAVEFEDAGAHAFTVKWDRDVIMVEEQVVRLDERGVAVAEKRTVRGDQAVDLWADHLSQVAGPGATYHGLAFKSDGNAENPLLPDQEPTGRPGVEFPIHPIKARPPERGPPEPRPWAELSEPLRWLRADAAAELARHAANARNSHSEIEPAPEPNGVSPARLRDRVEHLDALAAALADAHAQYQRAAADLTRRITRCRDLNEREVRPGSGELREVRRRRDTVQNVLASLLHRTDAPDGDVADATAWLRELDEVVQANADYEYRRHLLDLLQKELVELDTGAGVIRSTQDELAELRTRLGSTPELQDRLRDHHSAFDDRLHRIVHRYVNGGHADVGGRLTNEREQARFDAFDLTQWLRESDSYRRYSLSEPEFAELRRRDSPVRAEWNRQLDAQYDQLLGLAPDPPEEVAARLDRMRSMAADLTDSAALAEYSTAVMDFVARFDILSALDGIDRVERRAERIDALGAALRDIRSWLAEARDNGRPVDALTRVFDRMAMLAHRLDRLTGEKNRLPEVDDIEFATLSALRGFRHWELRPGRRAQQRLDRAVYRMRTAVESFLGRELRPGDADGLAKDYEQRWTRPANQRDSMRASLGSVLGRDLEGVGEEELTELGQLYRDSADSIPAQLVEFLRAMSAQWYLQLRRIAEYAELTENHRRLDAEWDAVLADAVRGLRGMRFTDGGESRPVERTFTLGKHLAGLRDTSVEQRAAAERVVVSRGRALKVESVWQVSPGSEVTTLLNARLERARTVLAEHWQCPPAAVTGERVEQRHAELGPESAAPAEVAAAAEIRALEPVIGGAERFHRHDAWTRAIDALDDAINAALWDEANGLMEPAHHSARNRREERAAWTRRLIELAHLLDDVAAARAAAAAEQRTADVEARDADLDRLLGELAAQIAIRGDATADSAEHDVDRDDNAAQPLPPDVRRAIVRRVDQQRALLRRELDELLRPHGVDPGQLLDIGSAVWEHWFRQHAQARAELVRLLGREPDRVDDEWLYPVVVHRLAWGDMSAELATAAQRFSESYAVWKLVGGVGRLDRLARTIESMEEELTRRSAEYQRLLAQAHGAPRADVPELGTRNAPAEVIRLGSALRRLDAQADRLYRLVIAVADIERRIRSLEPTRGRFGSSVRAYGLDSPVSRPELSFVHARLRHLAELRRPSASPSAAAPVTDPGHAAPGVAEPVRDLSELIWESTILVRLDDELYWLNVDLDTAVEEAALTLSGVSHRAPRPEEDAGWVSGTDEVWETVASLRLHVLAGRRRAGTALTAEPSAQFGIDPTSLADAQVGENQVARLTSLRAQLAGAPDQGERVRQLDIAIDLVRVVTRRTAEISAIDILAAAFDAADRRQDRSYQHYKQLSEDHVRRFPLDGRAVRQSSGLEAHALNRAIASAGAQLGAGNWDESAEVDELRLLIDASAQPNSGADAEAIRLAALAERYVGLIGLRKAFDERKRSIAWYHGLKIRMQALDDYCALRRSAERWLDRARQLSRDQAENVETEPNRSGPAGGHPHALRRMLSRAVHQLVRATNASAFLRSQAEASPDELDVRRIMSGVMNSVLDLERRTGYDEVRRRAERCLRLCLMVAAAEQIDVFRAPADIDQEFANLLDSSVAFAVRMGVEEQDTPSAPEPEPSGHDRNQCAALVSRLHLERTGSPDEEGLGDGGLGGASFEPYVAVLGGGQAQRFAIDPPHPLRLVVQALLAAVAKLDPAERCGVSVVTIEATHVVDDYGVNAHTRRLEYQCDEHGNNVKILLQNPGKGLFGTADEDDTRASDLKALWILAYDKHRNPLRLPGGIDEVPPDDLRIGRSDEESGPDDPGDSIDERSPTPDGVTEPSRSERAARLADSLARSEPLDTDEAVTAIRDAMVVYPAVLGHCLGQLSERQRRCIDLRLLQGRSLERVAKQLGATTYAVGRCVKSAVRRVVELLPDAIDRFGWLASLLDRAAVLTYSEKSDLIREVLHRLPELAYRCLDKLPPGDRRCAELRFREGLGCADIAEHLNKTVTSVESSERRAVNHFIEVLPGELNRFGRFAGLLGRAGSLRISEVDTLLEDALLLYPEIAHSCLAQLADQNRECVMARRRGYDVVHVAKRLGKTPKAVQQSEYRGLRRFAELLPGELDRPARFADLLARVGSLDSDDASMLIRDAGFVHPALLRRCLYRLPRQQRKWAEARWLQDRTVDQAAEQLAKSGNSASKLERAALPQLVEMLPVELERPSLAKLIVRAGSLTWDEMLIVTREAVTVYQEAAQRCLEGLTEQERICVELCILQDRTPDEVAAHLGITDASVRATYRYGVGLFVERLGAELVPDPAKLDSVYDWLEATRLFHRESRREFSVGIGLSYAALQHILRTRRPVRSETLRTMRDNGYISNRTFRAAIVEYGALSNPPPADVDEAAVESHSEPDVDEAPPDHLRIGKSDEESAPDNVGDSIDDRSPVPDGVSEPSRSERAARLADTLARTEPLDSDEAVTAIRDAMVVYPAVLGHCLGQLSERQRRCIDLRVLQGRSSERVAKQLGITAAGVGNSARFAVRRVAELLPDATDRFGWLAALLDRAAVSSYSEKSDLIRDVLHRLPELADRCLAELSPEERRCLQLRFRDGLSRADIAEQSHQTESSVKNSVRKGVYRFIKVLPGELNRFGRFAELLNRAGSLHISEARTLLADALFLYPSVAHSCLARLSDQERECLELLGRGFDVGYVARQLNKTRIAVEKTERRGLLPFVRMLPGELDRPARFADLLARVGSLDSDEASMLIREAAFFHREVLRRCLHQLPRQQRKWAEARWLQDRTVDRAAKELGKTMHAASQMESAVMTQLVAMLPVEIERPSVSKLIVRASSLTWDEMLIVAREAATVYQEAAQRSLEGLAEQQRICFEDCILRDRSPDEVAAELGVTATTVRSSYRNGMVHFIERLRAELMPDPAAFDSVYKWLEATRLFHRESRAIFSQAMGRNKIWLNNFRWTETSVPRLVTLRIGRDAGLFSNRILRAAIEKFYDAPDRTPAGPDEEAEFWRYIETAVGSAEERQIRNHIYERFDWLAVAVARRWARPGNERDELTQYFRERILSAIANHVPFQSFIAHASGSCRVSFYYRDKSYGNLGPGVGRLVGRVRAYTSSRFEETGVAPDDEEISRALGLTISEVAEARRLQSLSEISINQPVADRDPTGRFVTGTEAAKIGTGEVDDAGRPQGFDVADTSRPATDEVYDMSVARAIRAALADVSEPDVAAALVFWCYLQGVSVAAAAVRLQLSVEAARDLLAVAGEKLRSVEFHSILAERAEPGARSMVGSAGTAGRISVRGDGPDRDGEAPYRRPDGHARNQCAAWVSRSHLDNTGSPDAEGLDDVGLGGVFWQPYLAVLGGGRPQKFPIDRVLPLRFVVQALLAMVARFPAAERNGVSVVIIEGTHVVDGEGVNAHTRRLEYRCDEQGNNVRLVLQDPAKRLKNGVREGGVRDDLTRASDLNGLWAQAYDKHRNPLRLPGGVDEVPPDDLRIGQSDEESGTDDVSDSIDDRSLAPHGVGEPSNSERGARLADSLARTEPFDHDKAATAIREAMGDDSSETPRSASPTPWSGRTSDRVNVTGAVGKRTGGRDPADRLSKPSPGSTPWSKAPEPSGSGAESTTAPTAEGRKGDGDEPVPPEAGESAGVLPPLTIHFCTKDRPERMAALLDDIAAVVPGRFTVFIYDDSVDPENRARNRHIIDNASFDVVYVDEERRTALLASMPWPSEAARRFTESAFKVLGRPEWNKPGVLTLLQFVAVVCGAPSDRALLLDDDIRLRDGIFRGELVSVDSQVVTELLSTPVPDGKFIGIGGHYAGKKDVNHVEDAAATVGTVIQGQSYLHSGIDASGAFLLTDLRLLGEVPFPHWYGEDNFVMAIWMALGYVLDAKDFSPLHTGDDRDIELDVALRQQYGIVSLLAVLEAGRAGADNVSELLRNAVSHCGKYAWKVAQRWAENFAIREHEFGNIHIDNVSALLAVEEITRNAEAALRGYASSLIGWTDLVRSEEVSDHVRSFLGIGGDRISVPWIAPVPRPGMSYADTPDSPELEHPGNPAVDADVSTADGTMRQSLSGAALSAVGASADGTVGEGTHSDFATANRLIIDYALGKLRGNVYDSIGMLLAWVEVSVRAALVADRGQDDSDADYRAARARWEITSEHVMDKIVDSVTEVAEGEMHALETIERWLNEVRERTGIRTEGITPADDFMRLAEALFAFGVEYFWRRRESGKIAEIYSEFCRSRNLSDDIVQRWYRELREEGGFSVDGSRDPDAFRDLVTGTDLRAVESLVSRSMSILADRLGSLHFTWYSSAPRAKLRQWRISTADLIQERRWIAPERQALLSDFMREFRKPLPDTRRLRRAATPLWEPGPGIEMPGRLKVPVPRGTEKYITRLLLDSAQRRLWLAGLTALHSMWRRRLDPFDYRMECLRRMVAPYEVDPDQVLDDDAALWHDALDGARVRLIRLWPAASRSIGPDNPSIDDGVIRMSVARLVASGQVTGEFAAAASEYLEVLQMTDLIHQIGRLRRSRRGLADAERLAEVVSELFNKWQRYNPMGGGAAQYLAEQIEGWAQRIYELGVGIDEIEQSQWMATADLVEQMRVLSCGDGPAGVVPDPAARPEIFTELDAELRDLNGELSDILDKVDVVARGQHLQTQQSSSTESDSGESPFGPGLRWIRSVTQEALNDRDAALGASKRSLLSKRVQRLNNLEEAWRDAWRRQEHAEDVLYTRRAAWRDLDVRADRTGSFDPAFLEVLRVDLRHRRDRLQEKDSSALTEDEAAIDSQLDALDAVITAEIDHQHYESRAHNISHVIRELETEADLVRFDTLLIAGRELRAGREPESALFEFPFASFDETIARIEGRTDIDSINDSEDSRNIYDIDTIPHQLYELRILLENRLHNRRALINQSEESPDTGRWTELFQRVHDRVELMAARVDLLLPPLRDMREWIDARMSSADILARKFRLVFDTVQRLHVLHPFIYKGSRTSYRRFSHLCQKHGFSKLLLQLDRSEYQEIVTRRNIVSLRISSGLQLDPNTVTDAELKSIRANLWDSNQAKVRRHGESGKVSEGTVTLSGEDLGRLMALISEFSELRELETLYLSLGEMDRLDGEVDRILQNAVRAVYGGLNLLEQGPRVIESRSASLSKPVWALHRWAWFQCHDMEKAFDRDLESVSVTERELIMRRGRNNQSIWQVQPNSEGQRTLAMCLRNVVDKLVERRGLSYAEVTPERVRRLRAFPGTHAAPTARLVHDYLALHSAESDARRFHRYSRWEWAIRALDAAIDPAQGGTGIGESALSELRRCAATVDQLARKWDRAMSRREKIRTRFADWNINPNLFTDWLQAYPLQLSYEIVNHRGIWERDIQHMAIAHRLRDQAFLIIHSADLIEDLRNSEYPLTLLNSLFDDAAECLLELMVEQGLDPGPFRDFRSAPHDDLRAHAASTLARVRGHSHWKFTYALEDIDLVGIARSGRSPISALRDRLADAGEALVRQAIAASLDPRVLHIGHVEISPSDTHRHQPAANALRDPKFFELAKEFREYDRVVTELDDELDNVLSRAAARILEAVPSAGDKPETVDAPPENPAEPGARPSRRSPGHAAETDSGAGSADR
ncbi:hypothetical protein K8O92_10240 [Nocardia asteroides]|nr:hypothetical protein K8O92_10240 [Nocardia asteroides]